MGLDTNIIAGPVTLSDGAKGLPRAGRTSETVVTELHGKYEEATFRGLCFTGSTPAAGVTVPIYSSTTQQCVLFNPLTSGKRVILNKCYFGYISGTDVAGHFVYAVQTVGTNAVTGTASALVTCNYVGQGYGTVTQLLTAVTVTAFTYLRPTGHSQVAQTAAGTNAPWTQVDDIDGSIQLSPGTALAFAANAAAFVVGAVAFTWTEVPYP